MVAKLSYEESRRQRLEENKKRMEALNLPLLSQALRNSPSPKPSPMKQVKPRSIEKKVVVLRRSNRVANIAAPVYKEAVIDRVAIPRRVYNKRRDLKNRLFASEEARIEACKKAEKLKSGLESEYPTFYKSMLPSHEALVRFKTYCQSFERISTKDSHCLVFLDKTFSQEKTALRRFILSDIWGLPADFCKKSLPKSSEVMTLIDEDGNEYPTVYLARKTGLSGGWKGFAEVHNLADGDAVVFQLIRRTAFKVYIIRANGPRKKV